MWFVFVCVSPVTGPGLLDHRTTRLHHSLFSTEVPSLETLRTSVRRRSGLHYQTRRRNLSSVFPDPLCVGLKVRWTITTVVFRGTPILEKIGSVSVLSRDVLGRVGVVSSPSY